MMMVPHESITVSHLLHNIGIIRIDNFVINAFFFAILNPPVTKTSGAMMDGYSHENKDIS
jgi:hypothetical protein